MAYGYFFLLPLPFPLPLPLPFPLPLPLPPSPFPSYSPSPSPFPSPSPSPSLSLSLSLSLSDVVVCVYVCSYNDYFSVSGDRGSSGQTGEDAQGAHPSLRSNRGEPEILTFSPTLTDSCSFRASVNSKMKLYYRVCYVHIIVVGYLQVNFGSSTEYAIWIVRFTRMQDAKIIVCTLFHSIAQIF